MTNPLRRANAPADSREVSSSSAVQDIGHTTGSNKNYLDWDEIGEEWYEKCADKMTWLNEKPIAIFRTYSQQERQINELSQKGTRTEKELQDAKDELLALPPDQLELWKGFVR